MIIRTIKECIGTDREVVFNAGISYRPVLKSDKMGFSIHKTVIQKGNRATWHYKNHLESCYCISGKALLQNMETGQKFIIEPDTVYSLDRHDWHYFEALEDTVLISVFNPPCTGQETHQPDGSYAI